MGIPKDILRRSCMHEKKNEEGQLNVDNTHFNNIVESKRLRN